jgi:hypothetical protein
MMQHGETGDRDFFFREAGRLSAAWSLLSLLCKLELSDEETLGLV